jgi:hypothetical protein
MSKFGRAGPHVVIGLVVALTASVAWAYWSASSTPGGNGAAAAATVNQGATPAAVPTGAGATVTWAASTLSNGVAVSGYVVTRYDATTLVAQSTQAACSGTVTATSCVENGLPTGQWVYTITPVLGTNWRGPESLKSSPVTTDATAPTNAISVSAVAGNAVKNASVVFYRGVAGGSLTLANAVADTGSGPASSSTAALTGSSAGWTHIASTVSVPSGGPYVSNPFSWAAGTTSAPTDVVTGRDGAGNTAATTLSFVNDSTTPTPGSINYSNGYQPGQSVIITFTAGTDAGSGIATRQLQRSQALLTSGVCGSFSGFANVGVDSPTSPYTDSQVSIGSCYQYRYVVTDQVSNQDTATSANVAKIDPDGGGPALGSAGPFSVLAGTGVVNTLGTNVSGDLGVSPSNSVSGFPPGIVAGTIHAGDSTAAAAQAALVLAYADAAARTPTSSFAGDQNGATFHPGVYSTAAAFALTGTMTLNGDGNPNSIFVFQVNAALNTAAASNITLTNGAQASHVFWQVNGAAGTGASSFFSGTIMAAGAITLGAGTQLIGRALSYGTVTMAGNTIRFTSALPPTVTIDDGATAVTKNPTPTITGTSNAAVATTVTVKVAGQVLTTTVQSNGTWIVAAAALTAGAHDVVAVVRDAAGNAGTATQALTVEINPALVSLGTTGSYSVLAGTGVVNTLGTNVSGDLGISPSNAISGFPPGLVAGTTHIADSAASIAQADLVLAYNDAAGRASAVEFAGDQNGRTFHDGVYHTAAAFALTGTMTLDGEGDPNATFIFQVGAALNTAAASTISLINGAQASHVFWQVNGAAGLGASSFFSGTILATGGITLGASAQLIGRALTYGTVTMSGNAVRFTAALPPTMTITGGTAATTKSATPTITGTTNAPAATTVTVRVDAQVFTTTVQSNGTWSVTAAALTVGAHSVVAAVRDTAGNAGNASQALLVELNPAAVALGSAATYSVLGTGVTNTLVTHLTGDLGVSPSGSNGGLPPALVGGATHVNDGPALQAHTDLVAAYNNAAARTPTSTFSGDQIGHTFHDGVYSTATAFALTGTMTLDGEGDPNATFIFQIGAALNTAAASQVSLINGAQASHVYWQVVGATGIGGLSAFTGTILSAGGITLGAAATLNGRALSYGLVTLTNNTINS